MLSKLLKKCKLITQIQKSTWATAFHQSIQSSSNK